RNRYVAGVLNDAGLATFEEPGTLEAVAERARDWFLHHSGGQRPLPEARNEDADHHGAAGTGRPAADPTRTAVSPARTSTGSTTVSSPRAGRRRRRS
ncbi:MAG TPA: hypothetical protein VGF32_19670, partial [Streptosporangiaceae bacterium]